MMKDFPKSPDDLKLHSLHIRNLWEKIGQTHDRIIAQATGNDPVPIRHIRTDVQGKTVTGDPVHIHLDTDRRNFRRSGAVFAPAARATRIYIRLDPDTRQAWELTGAQSKPGE